MNRDIQIIRDLAKKYTEISADPVMNNRRQLWRDLHSLKKIRPLIHVRQYAFNELPQSNCVCEDALCREIEFTLRDKLYAASLNDDTVFEPYYSVRALFLDTDWGVQIQKNHTGDSGGAFKVDYVLENLEVWPKAQIGRASCRERV